MTTIQEFSSLLTAISNELDIPDELHQEAALKYEEVGIWLAAEGGSLANYAPDIYPQGSFRLGTVVRPIDTNCDYDIDLVCVIERQKTSVTQVELKKIIGDRLRENTDYAKRLNPSRRAWNLNFPKQFHLDVLPSIPNVEQDPNGILLTDTELKLWQKSNPIDYADWFYESMKVQVKTFKETLAKSLSLSVEEVPDWQVKTPLQRAIQILKRHRDVRFASDPENRPVSIILTTLAAHAYKGEDTVYDAILRLVSDMPGYIEVRNGRWWVENPVESDENFADKWNEKPERRDAFLKWLVDVRRDMTEAAEATSLNESTFILKKHLSGDVESARAKLLNEGLAIGSFTGRPTAPEITVASHSQAPTWPLQVTHKASIKASLHYAKGARKISDLARRRISKKLWIKFSLETTTPEPYGVFWKVVNTGAEARAANQLRGNIFPEESGTGRVRWEHTAYTGTHWVEAYIVKNGRCVAISERKYVLVR
jgi:hypothetical protein